MKEPNQNWFFIFSNASAGVVGSAWTFVAAIIIVMIWAFLGPVSGYSEPWQLMINTGTTIISFLIVFLIQNTQNRDSRAIHLKINELIRAYDKARNKVLDLENCSEKEIKKLEKEFRRLRKNESALDNPNSEPISP